MHETRFSYFRAERQTRRRVRIWLWIDLVLFLGILAVAYAQGDLVP